jgi:Ca2+-binding EF-hand superfamily protein
MYLEPLEPDLEKEVSKIKIDPQVLKAIKRLFYTFDFDKNKTLSLSEVRKGFAYMAIEKQGKPPKQEELDAMFQKVADPNTERLSFPGFLRMFSMTMTKKGRFAVAA